MKKLFELNPSLDRKALAVRFAETGRVQIRDVLTPETARGVLTVLASGTPRGMATGAGEAEPQSFRMEKTRTPQRQQAFNTLSLFKDPQTHCVSYVAPFAPIGRMAATGWLRTV